MLFSGTHTALVTPFHADRIDLPAFEKLIAAQIAAGVDGLVAVGTTGESPTLDNPEHIAVIRATVEFAAGRSLVIAGTGSNATAEAIELTRAAEAVGAGAILLVAPYYNKPSQAGLFLHFRAVAEATGLPVILYSIPGRCGVAIDVSTVARLREACPNIVAIKEAGGRTEKVSALRRTLGPDFAILSGDDGLTLPFLAAGADGVVSVASNLIPATVVEMVRLALANDFLAARAIHLACAELFEALFVETNPVPVKHALVACGLIPDAEVRLPLCGLAPESEQHLLSVLDRVPATRALRQFG